MTNLPAFEVTAIWDGETDVWVSQTNIRGLVIEADTLEEFESLVFALAPDMIRDNHLSPAGLADKPASEVIPTVIWRRPAEAA